MEIKSFEDLEVWKRAKELTEDIDQIGIKINDLISATKRRASEQ